MGKSKKTISTLGSFGIFMLVLGVFLSAITQNVYIGAGIFSFGIILLLVACITDRLDTIIRLLSQLVEQNREPQSDKQDHIN